jgi:hypothetical protein
MLVVSAAYATFYTIQERTISTKNLLDVCYADLGNSIIAWYREDETVIARVDRKGQIGKYITYDTLDNKYLYTIRGMAFGEEGLLYLLRDVKDKVNGNLEKQQLVIYDFSGFFARELKVFELNERDENYIYGWLNVSGETITMIATDGSEEIAIRRSYEYGSLLAGTLNIKNTTTYPLAGEGIYQAMGNSTDLVYISDSGKIFRANEEAVQEVFPARDLETLMYPLFFTYAESGYIFFEEKVSGNIVKLNLADGSEDIVRIGDEALDGASSVTFKDFAKVSMSNLNVYTAVVYNNADATYNVLTSYDGSVSTIDKMNYSLLSLIKIWVLRFLLTFLGLTFSILMLYLLVNGIRKGKTIMGRLVYICVPLLMTTMGLFGVIAYRYYRDAVEENFIKQTENEGDTLRAVLGEESLNEIEFPYDYTSEAYHYLSTMLSGRELYSRIMYYEADQLYTGIDRDSPCFYPMDIWMNGDAIELYRQVALTGKRANRYIADQLGERLVSVTPLGGKTGETVYLMETSIFISNIDENISSYVRNLTAMTIAFFIIIIVLLSVAFYRILSPLQNMRFRMSNFIEGDSESRIVVESEDELAVLSRIFNKMADDTIIQKFKLEKITATYYRFLPEQMLKALKIENLGDMNLDSKISGRFVVMWASLDFSTYIEREQMEHYANIFFSLLNSFAVRNQVVLVSGRADLHNLVMFCSSVDSGINTALSVLAKVDADNTALPVPYQMKVNFILHHTEASFRISGDEVRYIPALFAPGLTRLLRKREFLLSLGSRILLSGEAFEAVESQDSYSQRYIGEVRFNEARHKMYDIYDDKSANEIKNMRYTAEDFKRAMELFEEGAYYDAKNIFTKVLRYNLVDKAAKHYIFECEAKQRTAEETR